MADYIVVMQGDLREVYIVTADSEEAAKNNWMNGSLLASEAGIMEVESVRLDEVYGND